MAFSNCYYGKKVLITGHTGFKGSWLSIWLTFLGAEVYGYALPPYTDRDNFSTCKLSDKLSHREGDVRDLSRLKLFFNEVQPDFAFHLAAQPLVLLSYREPVNTFETNVMGVVNFFEAVKSTPSVQVAINVTSDKCYDNKEWVWGYRENDAMGGKDPYSASKGCAELITSSYLHSFFLNDGCNVASARAGNVIGGGDWAQDRIVPDFFRSIQRKEPLFVRNPLATRPWQHVLEPLSGYLGLGAALSLKGKKFCGGWNFGPEDSSNYSVGVLMKSIIDVHKSGIIQTPNIIDKMHEANLLKLDISKAVSYLHWKPVLSFKETIKFTVAGYEADLAREKIFENRLEQIEQYTCKALEKEILWTR